LQHCSPVPMTRRTSSNSNRRPARNDIVRENVSISSLRAGRYVLANLGPVRILMASEGGADVLFRTTVPLCASVAALWRPDVPPKREQGPTSRGAKELQKDLETAFLKRNRSKMDKPKLRTPAYRLFIDIKKPRPIIASGAA